MPVIETTHDEENLTLTMVAEFAAPPERVWEVYADPRQLEKVWGPPTYPATVVDHSLVPGGRVTYFMTSPEGEKFCGLWEVSSVDAPRQLAFRDYFADEDFSIDESMPGSGSVFTFSEVDGGDASHLRIDLRLPRGPQNRTRDGHGRRRHERDEPD